MARDLTITQKAALINCGKNGPVVVINDVTARALIRLGYMKQADIFPTPVQGIAVSLTGLGKSWLNA